MNIKNTTELKAEIIKLKHTAALQKEQLTNQFCTTCKMLQPKNIIKNQLDELVNPTNVSANVVDAAIGLAAGVLSKKIYVRGSTNIFKNIVGTVIELGVANVAVKNSNKIKASVAHILGKLFSSKQKK